MNKIVDRAIPSTGATARPKRLSLRFCLSNFSSRPSMVCMSAVREVMVPPGVLSVPTAFVSHAALGYYVIGIFRRPPQNKE